MIILCKSDFLKHFIRIHAIRNPRYTSRIIGGSGKMETKTRTLAKAISWQVVGLFTMGFLAWLQTGSIRGAFGFALTAALVSAALFFVHERLWGRIAWGRRRA